jgi:large subunit ribosomal protein L29
VKAAEFQDLDAAEMRVKESEIREQIFRLKFQITMGQTDGVKKYRALRKDLARLLTVRRQAELQGAN